MAVGNYTFAVPETPAATNITANDHQGPPIAVGTPLNLADIPAEYRETKTIRNHAATVPSVATPNELSQALCREHAMIDNHVLGTYYGGAPGALPFAIPSDAPAWTVGLFAGLALVNAGIANANAAIVNANAGIVANTAMMLNFERNRRIYVFNREAFDQSNGNVLVSPALRSPLKLVPGAGAALPPAETAFPTFADAIPAVGNPLPAPFPANVDALNALTDAHINSLSIMANDTFGIVAVDNVTRRRQKFKVWLQGNDL